jgi:hypothetical protein
MERVTGPLFGYFVQAQSQATRQGFIATADIFKRKPDDRPGGLWGIYSVRTQTTYESELVALQAAETLANKVITHELAVFGNW